MRKLKNLLCMILLVMAIKSQGNIILNDGQYHILDYYERIPINVDSSYGDTLGTCLEIVQGGKCGLGVGVGNTGKVILNGGFLTGLGAHQDSLVTILSGTVNYYGGSDNSHLEMSGGIIVDGMRLVTNSTATISGGTLGGDFDIRDFSILTLVGSDFTINGVSVSLYEDIKNYATYEFINDGIYGYTGTITGTLTDGSSLNNYFEIWDNGGVSNANIFLIPEPCSVLLLGFGVVGVLRRRRVGENYGL